MSSLFNARVWFIVIITCIVCIDLCISRKLLSSVRESQSNLAEEITECTMCLEALSKEPVANKIDCGHPFHTRCLIDWLKKHDECPTCQRSIISSNNAQKERSRRYQQQERPRFHSDAEVQAQQDIIARCLSLNLGSMFNETESKGIVASKCVDDEIFAVTAVLQHTINLANLGLTGTITVNSTTLPSCAESLELSNNQLAGNVDLSNVPLCLKYLGIRNNPISGITVTQRVRDQMVIVHDPSIQPLIIEDQPQPPRQTKERPNWRKKWCCCC